MTDHLTIANPSLQALIDATPPGMMHWSGSGPADAVCFGCAHFNQRKLRSVLENEYPQIVRGACTRYHRVTSARAGRDVSRRIFDPFTAACSHYVEQS
jgi:hypothetical protein